MGQLAKEIRGEKKPIYQIVPMATLGGGWIKDGLEARWGKIRKLRMNPGILIKIAKRVENEGGLVEKKPVDYFLKNGQTTSKNQATVDGCTPDQVYEALNSHPELGKRFKLVQYTQTQAEANEIAERQRAIVGKGQTLVEGSPELAQAKADARFQTPGVAMSGFTVEAINDASLSPMTVAGVSSLPGMRTSLDGSMATSEILPLDE